MFFLSYRYTDDGVFDDFPKISDHFPKIYEDSPKLVRRSHEDYRRLSKTFKEDPKMFRWYTNELKYNLRDKLDISKIDIFTSVDMENMLLESRLWFRMNFTSCVFSSKTLVSIY